MGRVENATDATSVAGSQYVCIKGQECWIHPRQLPHIPEFDATYEAAGGRDITIFLQSAPRAVDSPGDHTDFFKPVCATFNEPTIADGGTMMLATLASIRRAARLPHAPAVLTFDGLECSHRKHRQRVVRAYVDKIAQVARAVKGTQTQLVVHRIWLHAAEATRRSMLLQLTSTRLVFVGDDDFLFERSMPFDMLHLMMTSPHIMPKVRYVLFRWASFDGRHRNGERMPSICFDLNIRCKPHERSNGTLFSTPAINNMPHIALYHLYMETVWATVPYARTAIEHHANAFAHSEGNWDGWMYAAMTGQAVLPHSTIVTHLGDMAGLSANRFVDHYSHRDGAARLQ